MKAPITVWKYLADLSLWGLAGLLAYSFRQPQLIAQGFPLSVWIYVASSMTVMAGLEKYYGLHRQAWRRVGMADLQRLARAAAIATLVMFSLGFLNRTWLQLPRSVPIMGGVLGVLLLGGVRLLLRTLDERSRRRASPQRQRVLIVGAGDAGSLIAREMQRHPEAGLEPIGFVDDDPVKGRGWVLGLPVFGPVDSLAEVAEREHAQEILIAVPSADGRFVRHVVAMAGEAGVRYRIIPGVFEILSGEVNISQIRDVNVEDLLRRHPVKLDSEGIAGYLRDKVVLLTGAGGSIGSEIVRQIAPFGPAKLLLLGRGENSIFTVQQELAQSWPEIDHEAVIGDVRDEARLRSVFQRYRPEVVFHAAAHKHVPLMESAPSEAVLNNVLGTQNVVKLSLEFGVRRLVNISTDKAVNPTSVMGGSKRVAEMVVSAGAAQASDGQALVSVRFGNVLGSRGSVVPLFMNQIRAGGPVTVTHPEMRRYFMTIPEAARLVLQAGALAENGKVYLLNMGEPVRIADLAQDVIRLSGARNVDVVYSGIRPGEKLYEELLTTSEGSDATTHSEIYSARLSQVDASLVQSRVAKLQQAAYRDDSRTIRKILCELIPEHKYGQMH